MRTPRHLARELNVILKSRDEFFYYLCEGCNQLHASHVPEPFPTPHNMLNVTNSNSSQYSTRAIELARLYYSHLTIRVLRQYDLELKHHTNVLLKIMKLCEFRQVLATPQVVKRHELHHAERG